MSVGEVGGDFFGYTIAVAIELCLVWIILQLLTLDTLVVSRVIWSPMGRVFLVLELA
jgi:hypothetical protein